MGIPQPIGLIVLAETEKGKDRATLGNYLEDLMKNLNRQLEAHEKLEKLVVLPEAWTVENGLMTPTMKVKRNEVEHIHQSNYEEWFHHSEKIIWV
jgi:long-chain acyl-CoA synthetase